MNLRASISVYVIPSFLQRLSESEYKIKSRETIDVCTPSTQMIVMSITTCATPLTRTLVATATCIDRPSTRMLGAVHLLLPR